MVNKADFAGVAPHATAFPPGSTTLKGRAAIEAMWKGMAEQVSDPKFITLDVKPLGASAAREIVRQKPGHQRPKLHAAIAVPIGYRA
jgi:hypothetical protein